MTEPASPPPASPSAPHPVAMPWRQSLAVRLRNYFLAGLLVTAPISITLYFAWSIVDYVDSTVNALIPAHYNPMASLPFAIPGLGIVLLVITLTLVGFLTANFLGRVIVRFGESAVARMPVVSGIYAAVKQVFETMLSDKARSFSEVVLVEFPRNGMWTLGLVIGKSHGEIQEKTRARFPDDVPAELQTVYVPTTPNPTSGYLVFVPRKDMIVLEMTVEECLKMVVSGGIVAPSRKARPVTGGR